MRDYFPLFCTAQLIDDLLQKSESGHGNVWTLVKTSTQTTFEKPTEPPVSTSLNANNFTTSFTSTALDTLGDFCKTHSLDKDKTPIFAILDERSINDSTVLLVKWEIWTEYIDIDDDSNLTTLEGWQTMRTYFEDAAYMIDSFEYLPVDEITSTERFFDENGVHVSLRSRSGK